MSMILNFVLFVATFFLIAWIGCRPDLDVHAGCDEADADRAA